MKKLIFILVAMVSHVAMGENLLEDPGFEKGQAAWKVSGAPNRYSVNGGQLVYSKDAEGPLSKDGKKENVHIDQIVAVKPNTAYVVGARFKAEGNLRPVLRLTDMDWQTVKLLIAPPANGEWQEVRTIFKTTGQTKLRVQLFGGALSENYETAIGMSYCDDVFLHKATEAELAELRQCRVTVDAGKTTAQVNPLFFGVNALFWIEDDDARADGKIGKYLKEMPCRMLRYPGGEVADNFHWKTNLLDSNKDFPKEEGPGELEFDEFMVWCREIGAEPILVVNLESGFLHGDVEAAVREAADWVRYTNIERGYSVKYWEIGNETNLKGTRYSLTSREYAEAVILFSKAMKAVDPSIQIGALGPRGTTESTYLDQLSTQDLAAFRRLSKAAQKSPVKELMGERKWKKVSWWDTVTELAEGDFDFAIIHQYSSPETYENFSQNPNTEGENVANLHGYFQARLGHRTPIALTEWNTSKASGSRGVGPSLMLSDKISCYLEGGVDMACFWPLRYNEKSSAFRGMLEMETNEPRPPYHVMKLYASNIGDRLVKHVSSNEYIQVLASRNDGRIALFVTNKSPEADGMDVSFQLDGVKIKTTRATTLAADSIDSTAFDYRHPAVKRAGKTWNCRLPPFSVTLLEFHE